MRELNKVIGYDSIKRELDRFLDAMHNPEKYQQLGVKVPRGILFDGVPGIGKTLLAMSFIKESGRTFYVIRKDKPDGSFVDYIREIFQKASENTPSIVFLDDMDKFANEDEYHRDAEEYVTIQACIDDVKEKDVFVVATTNNIRTLPNSLIRSGRFDRIFYMSVPRNDDARKIIAYYLQDMNLCEDIDSEELARFCRGYSCADLERVINEAGLYVAFEGREKINQNDLIKSCLRTFYKVSDDEVDVSEDILKRHAVHEAGHCVIAEILQPGTVDFISIASLNGSSIGGLVSRDHDEDDLFSNQEAEIMINLAGKAATEIVLAEVDMGCNTDLHRAYNLTRILLDNVAAYDFNSWCHGNETSEQIYDHLDSVTNAEVSKYYLQVKQILIRNRAFLDSLIEALIEKKTISYKELAKLKEAS
ncbi:AAA family ATPase [Pseudobutyrivibrio sp. MD2005]|uniref:AAA family ATPase n=1 Tax=Pseudobutyrivibrio sp. MD2005 TaxID=1410616 RepID=UPI000489C19F|nr:AAA family ATPase [Pseudobutyrivibrio sp. MD2005]